MTETELIVEEKVTVELKALRALHQVSLVDEKDEGSSAEKLAKGIYGFSWAPQAEAPLFRKQGFQSFEVHKAADGEVYIIGYVNEDDAGKLASAEKEDFLIHLFPSAYEKATQLVSIARSQILQHSNPTRDAGNSIKLKVEPSSAPLQ